MLVLGLSKVFYMNYDRLSRLALTRRSIRRAKPVRVDAIEYWLPIAAILQNQIAN